MPPRLHEREHETAVIAAALDAVAAGRGGAVVVEGPAGIGKTSLLELGRDGARQRALAVASARGSELEAAYAWGVVRQLLEPRLRGMAPAARARTLSGAAALAGPVVLPDATARAGDADPSFGVLHGLYWLVVALAAQRPQVLLVDDLHWADAASVRFLEFLANRLDAIPVLLLAAQRPPAASAEAPLRGAPLATPVAPAALSVAATAAVLAERDGAPVPAALAAACHDATGGNPLLVRRLADGLGDDDPAAVGRDGPYAVAGAVGATLARLGDGPARLARAVAVLERTPLVTVAQLAGGDPRTAPALAEELVRAGLLRDARPLAFEHALVRDAVLSGLAAGERASLHAQAARILAAGGAGPEAVAMHLLHAEPRGDAAVAATLAEAGRRALAAAAAAEAAACIARALAEPPPPGDRAALLLDLARAEHEAGRAEALDQVLEAWDGTDDPDLRARAALALAWASGPGRQDPEAALAMIDAAIAGVAGRDRELELRLEAIRYMAIFLSSALMLEALGEPERFAALEGRTAGEGELLLHVAIHRLLLGRSADAVAEPLERAVADPAVVAAIGPDSAWLNFVLSGLFKADRLDLARRTASIAFADAQRRGSAPGFAAASAWRAWIALREGDAAAAEADARAAYGLLPVAMWQHHWWAACLIEVLVERGALDEAQAVLEAAGGAGPLPPDRGGELLLSTRSIVRAAQGELPGALADQLESRRRRGDGFQADPDFDGWIRIVRLLHLTGDAAAAQAEADAALGWARMWGTPGAIGQALAITGPIRGGDAGIAILRDAVEQLERSPARRELALALIELGGALRRRGERAAAREPLRRALAIATAGGLVATADRARDELRVTGAKLRRPELTGLGSLTPSERRIVDLAAGGASNAEIAQGLFVTVKTVEMHLGNAYRKLGVGSRRDLAPLLAGAETLGSGTGSSP